MFFALGILTEEYRLTLLHHLTDCTNSALHCGNQRKLEEGAPAGSFVKNDLVYTRMHRQGSSSPRKLT